MRNSKAVKAALDEAAKEIVLSVQGEISREAPVQTGYLANHILFRLKGAWGKVFTLVPYAQAPQTNRYSKKRKKRKLRPVEGLKPILDMGVPPYWTAGARAGLEQAQGRLKVVMKRLGRTLF